MRDSFLKVLRTAVLAAGILLPLKAGAEVRAGSAEISWTSQVENEGTVLSVSGPDTAFRREFKAGETPTFSVFDADGKHRPDGGYTWELRAIPVLSREVREQLAAARAADDDTILNDVLAKLRRTGALPADESLVQTGSFFIENGAIVANGLAEPERGNRPRDPQGHQGKTPDKSRPTPTTAADEVIADDLIVEGSLCTGFDCVNNENFGFDTIRLKENNLRIHFDDTSATGFPANDWTLIANDSAGGGASKFSIEDRTGARTPFTVTAGAATNSIFVDGTGRVGFRTATPVLDLHVNTSNTPALRLEQNNSGGFTAQTWDIGANEQNFFVRDVTGGSLLSFRIRPGAPNSSIDVNPLGRIGFGTASPAFKLDAQGTNTADASLALTTFSDTQSPQVMLRHAPAKSVATQQGDVLGTLAFGGDYGAGLSTAGAATVHAFAEQPWGQNSAGAGLTLSTTFVNNVFAEPRLTIRHHGFVGIGTTQPREKLEVWNGNVLVTGGSFIADGTILNVPDYVFEPDYELMPIAELKAFIEQERHLPNVPDRGEVQAKGLDLSEFQMRLLEKVEELTLYAVRQHDEIQALRAQLAELEKALGGESR
jgi:hypothetical protein